MNKKIFISTLSILTVLAMMGSATFAYFSNQAQSTGNIFGAGALDLQIANNDGLYKDDVTATFNVPNIVPGQTEAQIINFKNNNSTPIAEIALKIDSNKVSTVSADLRTKLLLAIVNNGIVDSTNHSCTGGSQVTLPYKTLAAFNGSTFDSLPVVLEKKGDTGKICIQITFDNADDPNINDFQNTAADAAFTFIAHQNVSQ